VSSPVAIDEFFGSFDAFRNQLSEAAITVQGSGWGALSWEPLGQRLYIEQIYDHQGNTGQSGVPLLVVDAWEHAYYLQYQNRRADYIAAIWNILDWNDVATRFDRAQDLSSSASRALRRSPARRRVRTPEKKPIAKVSTPGLPGIRWRTVTGPATMNRDQAARIAT
jgi:hypothetical protein